MLKPQIVTPPVFAVFRRMHLKCWPKFKRPAHWAIVPTLLRGNAVGAASAAQDAERPQSRCHGNCGNDAIHPFQARHSKKIIPVS